MSLKLLARTACSRAFSQREMMVCLLGAMLFTVATTLLGDDGGQSGPQARLLRVDFENIPKVIELDQEKGQQVDSDEQTQTNDTAHCLNRNYAFCLPKGPLYGHKVIDALTFEPHADWKSWIVALVIWQIVCLGLRLIMLAKLDETTSRLFDADGLRVLAFRFYWQGMLLTFYRANTTLALIIIVLTEAVYAYVCVMAGECLHNMAKGDAVGIAMNFSRKKESNGDEAQEPEKMEDTVPVQNMYQNLGTSFYLVVSVFVLQFGFAILYLDYLATQNLENLDPYKYYAAVLLAVPCGNMMDTTQEVSAGTWAELSNWQEKKQQFHVKAKTKVAQYMEGRVGLRLRNSQVGWVELRLRQGMSSVVNVALPAILVATLPLFLSLSETRLDFVKDALAVVFIVDLDSLSGMDLTLERKPDERKPGPEESEPRAEESSRGLLMDGE